MLQYYNCGDYFIIRLYLIPLISCQRNNPLTKQAVPCARVLEILQVWTSGHSVTVTHASLRPLSTMIRFRCGKCFSAGPCTAASDPSSVFRSLSLAQEVPSEAKNAHELWTSLIRFSDSSKGHYESSHTCMCGEARHPNESWFGKNE